MSANTRTTRSSRRGFTLIEVLVSIGVIAVLLTIIVVAYGSVRRDAKRTITARLLTNIEQAIQTFETDMGYAPPLLIPDNAGYAFYEDEPAMAARTIVPEAQGTDAMMALQRARYMSEYSITAYLLGIGDIDGDAAGNGTGVFPSTELDDGKAGDGIRHPGRDKSWGGAADRSMHNATTTGRVLGPYIDAASLGDAREPGAGVGLDIDQTTGMYRILDAFGSPIRYYRHWPKFVIDSGNRTQSLNGVPYELLEFESVANSIEFGDPLSIAANRDVFSSDYMLVSAGMQPRTETVVAQTGKIFEGFGDITFDSGSGATGYIRANETGMLSTLFGDPSDPLWKGTRPLLESNIKVGS